MQKPSRSLSWLELKAENSSRKHLRIYFLKYSFFFFFLALTITLFVCTVNKVKQYARYDLETFCSI